MYKGIKIMTNNNINGGNQMLINNLVENLRKAKESINENAKYYSPIWKQEQLKKLKMESIQAFTQAIEEFEKVNKMYEDKIREIENSFYIGHSTSPKYLENVKLTKSRLLAEMKINPNNKTDIINKALSTKIGSQALLELIQNKEIDDSYWTDETFKKAYINSKSQAELDFEINKDNQIKAIKQEQAEKCNYGSYLAAIKILRGDVKAGIPTLERQFDNEIAEVENQNE